MTEDQIKHMVDRFLGWRLPKPWNPDNGISYARPNYAHVPADHDWPIGTNLFDAMQATAMVRHMIEGLPTAQADAVPTETIREELDKIWRLLDIAAKAGRKMRLQEQGDDLRLSHEVRMFAMELGKGNPNIGGSYWEAKQTVKRLAALAPQPAPADQQKQER